MVDSVKQSRILTFLVILAILVGLAVLPLEDSAALLVAVICFALATFVISIRTPDKLERTNILKLFCAAFGLRILFSVFVYKTGLIDKLGGADDQGWEVCWLLSRFWRGWLIHGQSTIRGAPGQTMPDTIKQIYDGSTNQNLGFHYWSTYFFYFLDVRSQLSLAFLNCFANALTVVLIYKSARQFFTARASYFAAGAATIMPGFLAWSALTIKEPWAIFFEAATIYSIWKWSKEKSSFYLATALFAIVMVLGIRFYAAWILVAASAITMVCARSSKPYKTAVFSVIGVVLVGLLFNALGIVHLDVAKIATERAAEMTGFREAIATGAPGSGGAGANSAVELDYNIMTPGGFIMMVIVGSAYLLLSPFPWQMGGRQIFALPDVLFWWYLVFWFILPGIRHAYRNYKQMLVSVVAFVLPLIVFYSLIFGNVGLAYRQRAQFMPFLLLLVAAGYEWKYRGQLTEKVVHRTNRLTSVWREKLQLITTTLPGSH